MIVKVEKIQLSNETRVLFDQAGTKLARNLCGGGTSNYISDSYSEIAIQAGDSASLTVNGTLDGELSEHPLACINMSTLEKVDTISNPGIYIVPAHALTKCSVTGTGMATVKYMRG